MEFAFLPQQFHKGFGRLKVSRFTGFSIDRVRGSAESAVHLVLKFWRCTGKQPGSDRFGSPQQKLPEKVEWEVQPGTSPFGQLVVSLGRFQQRCKAIL